jgi:predicted acetyltransferase
MNLLRLQAPDRAMLPSYLAALKTGWTPESDHDLAAAEQLAARVASAPEHLLSMFWNPAGQGPPVALDDGREVPRLAHVRHWIVDGDAYCGEVNLRWQPGSNELPTYCDGHVGYAVVPWMRRRGVARFALQGLARIAPTWGLKWIDIAMDVDNAASRRVAESAGATLMDEYVAVEQGGVRAYRYRLACGQ